MSDLPQEILEAVRESRGLSEDDPSQDREICNLAFADLLWAYLSKFRLQKHTAELVMIAKQFEEDGGDDFTLHEEIEMCLVGEYLITGHTRNVVQIAERFIK